MKSFYFWVTVPFLSFIFGFFLLAIFVQENTYKTPALLGHSALYALRQATEHGLMLKILSEVETSEVTAGTVIAQKPIPGAPIKQKQVIFITLSKSPVVRCVPNFVGKTVDLLNEALQSDILVKSHYVPHNNPKDKIIAQFPVPGTPLPDDRCIHLFISSGSETVRIMPLFCGHALQGDTGVEDFLRGYGIDAKVYTEPYDPGKHEKFGRGTIIAQKPLAGSWIDIKKPLQVQFVVTSI